MKIQSITTAMKTVDRLSRIRPKMKAMSAYCSRRMLRLERMEAYDSTPLVRNTRLLSASRWPSQSASPLNLASLMIDSAVMQTPIIVAEEGRMCCDRLLLASLIIVSTSCG
ncbi:hypothetical protein CFU_3315 [Collimonas fungivorans Ter331]|uniref:Uncharacterized protein n=1 Tax=Collimonas fungivorans (strain Ter331) TaxID=1005048 RepID=G0AAC5_COLFT|nr:hypothetical protein CFU_3315 [Collimonas fungivorans Ter331]